MFKEEKILAATALFLLLVLSLSLFMGLESFLDLIVSSLGADNPQVRAFLFNLLVVENTVLTDGADTPTGLLGFGFCFLVLVGLLAVRSKGRRRVLGAGILFIILGFLEMVLLDISVVGWLAGPMLMISGFLLLHKIRSYI